MMKKIIYLLTLILLSYNCSDSKDDNPGLPDDNNFSIEAVSSDQSPALWQQVGFYVKPTGGDIKSVLWDFGDKKIDSGIAVEHSYRAYGTYKVVVKATSKNNSVAEHTISLKVSDRSFSKALKHFDRTRVWLCAHRCNTGDVSIPENSIASLKKCIQLGYIDMVEIDPRVTSDGVIVIMHDETVNRTTNGKGKVSDLTYAQIQALRLKLPDGTVTQESVPTLDAFLKEAKGKIFIDLDYINKVPTGELYSLVKENGMLDEVMFYTSSNSQAINSILGYSPSGIVFTQTGKESEAVAYKDQGLFVTQISAAKILDSNLASIAAQNSQAVFSNTLVQNGITIDDDIRLNKDYSGVDKFVANGANIIQTDQSPLIHTYLKDKGKR